MAKPKIAIDAGHGSNTAGKRTPPFTKDVDINRDGTVDVRKGEQYREHYANTGVAALLYDKLVSRGYKVIKTGWDDYNSADDPDESLSSRQNRIKEAGCDYSISIHFNAFGDGNSFNNASGVGIYVHSQYPADSKHFAEYILRELVKGTKQTNRGIQEQRLAMCNCKIMNTKASILCELAFMTNEREALELMANGRFWEECAEEIANGFEKYCNCKNVEQPGTGEEIVLYHTVALGETLTKIAAKYNTTPEKLAAINQIKYPNLIFPGQKILLMKYFRYKIQKGDSLWKLSIKFLKDGNRYKEIMVLNNLNSTVIYIGQIIKIPVDII